MAAVEFSRWFLAAFFACVATFYTWTILVKKRRAGRSPVIRGRPGSLHHLIHQTFVVFRAAIFVVCLGRVPFPEVDAWLVPIAPLWRPAVILSGNLLMTAAFAAIVLIHRSMGADWRSGIDDEGPRRLITDGAFGITRNPMFSCIQVGQAGLFLSLPTLFTLICLIVGVTAIQAQVRLEEKHLARRWGEAYRDYAARVPRWPHPGRSRLLGRARTLSHRGPPDGMSGGGGPTAGR